MNFLPVFFAVADPFTILGFWFTFVVSISSLSYAAYRFLRVWRIRGWPTATGTVTRSAILSKPSCTPEDPQCSWSYAPDISVHFEVNGRHYTATKVTDADPYTSDYERQRGTMEAFPEGSSVEVAYNPGHPGDSVLIRSTPPSAPIALIVGFGLLTLAGLFWLINK